MKLGKLIGRAALGAFLVSVIPYSVKTDEKAGTMEIRSLLWALRTMPPKEGEKKQHYVFAIPPSGLDYAGAEGDKAAEEAEEAAEAPAEA